MVAGLLVRERPFPLLYSPETSHEDKARFQIATSSISPLKSRSAEVLLPIFISLVHVFIVHEELSDSSNTQFTYICNVCVSYVPTT